MFVASRIEVGLHIFVVFFLLSVIDKRLTDFPASPKVTHISSEISHDFEVTSAFTLR